MKTSLIFTFSDLRSQGIELLRWSLGHSSGAEQLPLANRVHHFYASDRTASRPKRLEAQHGTSKPFHCPMVLLHKIIEIRGVADSDSRLVNLVVARNSCGIRATLIDGDFLRQSLTANGFM